MAAATEWIDKEGLLLRDQPHAVRYQWSEELEQDLQRDVQNVVQRGAREVPRGPAPAFRLHFPSQLDALRESRYEGIRAHFSSVDRSEEYAREFHQGSMGEVLLFVS